MSAPARRTLPCDQAHPEQDVFHPGGHPIEIVHRLGFDQFPGLWLLLYEDGGVGWEKTAS